MFKHKVNTELQNLLQFWSTKTIDQKNGGFYGRIDGHNVLHPKADKGIILNTRILWTFAAAAQLTKDENHIQVATRAKDYLLRYFWDYDKGGVFWMADYQGNILDTKKQIYAQGFAMYAFVEYYKLTGDNTCLNKAVELFELIEQHSFDTENNGYLEAFSEDWVLLEDLRLSAKDANEKKTMNTHLHILEAYTNLYRVWKDKRLEKQLKNLIQLFLNTIIDHDSPHLYLFFDENWNIKSEEISFGHDIEASWLLTEAAEVLGNQEVLERVEHQAILMAAGTLKKAIDNDHAILYEMEDGKITDSDRHWWVQAEACVGFVNAYQLTKDKKYLTAAEKTWDYIETYLIDRDFGEWHWRTDANNQPILTENKVGSWKAPYHNVRACLEIMHRLK